MFQVESVNPGSRLRSGIASGQRACAAKTAWLGRRLALLAVSGLLGSAVFTQDVGAAEGYRPSGCEPSVMVTNDDDQGSGSLREAVGRVCASGTIAFSQRFAIQLNSEIVIDFPVTIDGTSVSDAAAGADESLVQINGGADVRVFLVEHEGHLTLRRVRISNGMLSGEGLGGGIFNAGRLAISESRFDRNQSGPVGALGGGAIFNDVGASLLVERSTFDHNVSRRGAAILNMGGAELYNSTFSANSTDIGDPLANMAVITNRADLIAAHITVSGNGSAESSAGGLFAFDGNTALLNSILSGNSGNDCQVSSGTFASNALLKGSGNCAAQIRGSARLESLADNGGVTRTMAVNADSPALGAGDPAFCLPIDQRGVERNRPNTCDVGAVEQLKIFASGFE